MIYGISDLHLSFSSNKSMEVFGPEWKDYENRVKEKWTAKVKDEDTVVIAGDISWALKMEESYADFKFIDDLPGKKLILKGNHDYYFSTKSKLDKYFKDNNINTIDVLYNNSYCVENYIIAGSRGWGHVDNLEENVDEEKIYKREAIRLELSIQDGIKKYGDDKKIIIATHFPPFYKEFQDVLQKYKDKIHVCIYGHLHGYGHSQIREGIIDGINYIMVSIDHNDCDVLKLN